MAGLNVYHNPNSDSPRGHAMLRSTYSNRINRKINIHSTNTSFDALSQTKLLFGRPRSLRNKKYVPKTARKEFLGLLKELVSGYPVISVMLDEQSVS